MKKISLKELNANGQLIVVCKKVAYVPWGERMPSLYEKCDPSVIYVHYYKDAYVVTQHIVGDRQFVFHELGDAYNMFHKFVDGIKD